MTSPDAQMPAAAGAGTEPVPYAGPNLKPEPPQYSVGTVEMHPPGVDVMGGVTGTMGVQESGYAHDVSSATVAPYSPGTPSSIYVGGDNDAGGRDDVESTIAGAVAAAEARYLEYQQATFTQGSTIGDLMTIPLVPVNMMPPQQQQGLYPFQGDEPPSVS